MPCPPRTLAALALSMVCAVACGADSPQSGALEAALAGELERLSAVLEAAAPTLPEALAGELESQRQALVAARRIEAAPLLLHRLAEVGVGVESLSFVAGHLDAAGDLARLEALWAERGPRFAAAPYAPGVLAPPLVAALASGAENRAEKLYRASLPYGRATQPLFGLYYLAQAEGELAYRDLVARLAAHVPGPAAAPPARQRVEAALLALESEMLAVFAGDPGGRSLVPVSARLKEARELVDRGSLEAAALALLGARLALSLEVADAGDAATPERQSAAAGPGGAGEAPATRAEVAAEELRSGEPPLPPGSIAAPFAALATKAADAATPLIIRRDVLPLYRSLADPTLRGDSP
jgi:hypothetical protein